MPGATRSKEAITAVALGVAVKSGELVLVRREREPFAGMWGLPGGKLRPGEHLPEAIRREFEEETGIRTAFDGLYGVVTEGVSRPGRPRVDYLLLVCRLTPVAGRLRGSVEGEARRFRLEELELLKQDMIPSDRLMLEHLVWHPSGPRYFRCEVRGDAAGFSVVVFE